jgi:hypothetical protein
MISMNLLILIDHLCYLYMSIFFQTGTSSIFHGTDSGGECGITTTSMLPLPTPATTNAPWWAYDVGLIHMVGISTEHDFSIGSPQYLWLENDLKSVDVSDN